MSDLDDIVVSRKRLFPMFFLFSLPVCAACKKEQPDDVQRRKCGGCYERLLQLEVPAQRLAEVFGELFKVERHD